MSDTTSTVTELENSPGPLRRPRWMIPYGVAAITSLLAAISYLFPSTGLAGVLVLFVAASSFGMAAQMSRDWAATQRLIASQGQLARDAARLQVFLHNARDGIHILDTDGRLVDASDSFCLMLGYSRDELNDMNVTQWDANFSAEKLKRFIPELFSHEETSTFETRHRRKDGSVFDVEISGCPIDMNGQRVLFHSARDITDRKALEERFRNIYASVLSAGEK